MLWVYCEKSWPPISRLFDLRLLSYSAEYHHTHEISIARPASTILPGLRDPIPSPVFVLIRINVSAVNPRKGIETSLLTFEKENLELEYHLGRLEPWRRFLDPRRAPFLALIGPLQNETCKWRPGCIS